MTAMWIVVAVAAVAVLVWRLRRAAALFDRILLEECDATRAGAANRSAGR